MRLKKHHGPKIRLQSLITELQAQNLTAPILLRFPDILQQRLADLQQAFHDAMHRMNYQGQYCPVYPIKVNQHRRVVETIADWPGGDVGLEAGSKAELLAILGLNDQQGRLIICNGYKDMVYLQLACLAQALGHRCYIVIEKLSELSPILELAKRFSVMPQLGVRIRLATLGKGKWQNSGGLKAKFGLTATQVVSLVERLKAEQCLSYLSLLHFHMGSQIANIRDIQTGLHEGARYYLELRQLGAPIQHIDIGGGLAIDYQGTRTRDECSMNYYTIRDYATHVVHTLHTMCEEAQLPHPNIITEAGRAMTAHHAVLVCDVIDRERCDGGAMIFEQSSEDPSTALAALQYIHKTLTDRSLTEAYHEACYWLTETSRLYVHGALSLLQRAQCEQLVHTIWQYILPRLQPEKKAHRLIYDAIHVQLANKLFGNFSLFQSAPDAWALKQIFPIMPLVGLNVPSDERWVIEDITCDSDGRFDYYIDGQSIEPSLPLPALPEQGPYYLGVFLVGAYQEILGDKHNLFGMTHVAEVCVDNQTFVYTHIDTGDTIADLLRWVHFDPAAIQAMLPGADPASGFV